MKRVGKLIRNQQVLGSIPSAGSSLFERSDRQQHRPAPLTGASCGPSRLRRLQAAGKERSRRVPALSSSFATFAWPWPLARLNTEVPEAARGQAAEKLTRVDSSRSLLQRNREF